MIPSALRDELQRAVALIKARDLPAAENLLRRIRQAAPGLVPVHVYLGLVAEASGRRVEAVQHLERAAQLAPLDAEIRLRLAQLHLRGGQSGRAAEHLQVATRGAPQRSEAWRMLGEALHLEKRIDEAVAALRRAVGLAPADVGALCALAKALFEAGDATASAETFSRAQRLAPQLPDAYLAAAQAQLEAGDVARAVEIYRQCVRQCPGAFDAWQSLAQALEDLGEREGAEQAYREALRLQPQRAHALAGLLSLLGADAEPALVEQGWARLDAPQSSDVAKALLGYGLGRVHHGRQEHARAFEAWRRANEARRRETGPFSRSRFRERIDAMMQTFTPAFFSQRRDWGVEAEAPTFIVGMPRSGTTLIEQVIAAHPHAAGLGELADIPKIASALHRRTGAAAWPASALQVTRAQIAEAAERHLQSLQLRAGADVLRIVDKAPLNYIHLGLIAWLFPRSRIIWCERDPRDVCLSIYRENFALQQTQATDLADLGFYYRQHERLMRYWLEALPSAIHRVRYESFVADPEPQARALVAFLGLAWDPACLQFHEQDRAVLTPSRWQVRQPIYRTAVGRWRVYERWLGPLLRELEAPAA